MKKALINPNEQASYIASYTYNSKTGRYYGNIAYYENSQIVCDVADTDFPVAPPFYWADCSDNIVAYQAYLDTTDGVVKEIINAPEPEVEMLPQPETDIESI
jgi:hypothetical protein